MAEPLSYGQVAILLFFRCPGRNDLSHCRKHGPAATAPTLIRPCCCDRADGLRELQFHPFQHQDKTAAVRALDSYHF